MSSDDDQGVLPRSGPTRSAGRSARTGADDAGSATDGRSVLLVAPLIGWLLAAVHVARCMGLADLRLGRRGRSCCSCSRCVIAAGSLGLSSWQHRAIVRPLRELARSPAAGADACRRGGQGDRPARPAARARRPPCRARCAHRSALGRGHARHARRRCSIVPLVEQAQQLLLVIDIARLRDVNGLHGFGFGDDLLRQFARRLTALAGAPPMVARMGGDRFALLVPNRGRRRGGGATAVAVTDAWPARSIAGCEVIVSVHSGAAFFPDHATGFDRLMRAAELALESTRRGDGRWRMFDPLLNRAAVARKTMEKELRARPRAGRADPSLPAAGRPGGRPRAGGRGAGALEAPRARPGGRRRPSSRSPRPAA